jgi:hypothetical protein
MTRQRGRPVIGAIAGLIFGLAIASNLLLMNVIPLDSALVVVLPVLGLILGIAGGLFAPLTFLRRPAVADEGSAPDELSGGHPEG